MRKYKVKAPSKYFEATYNTTGFVTSVTSILPISGTIYPFSYRGIKFVIAKKVDKMMEPSIYYYVYTAEDGNFVTSGKSINDVVQKIFMEVESKGIDAISKEISDRSEHIISYNGTKKYEVGDMLMEDNETERFIFSSYLPVYPAEFNNLVGYIKENYKAFSEDADFLKKDNAYIKKIFNRMNRNQVIQMIKIFSDYGKYNPLTIKALVNSNNCPKELVTQDRIIVSLLSILDSTALDTLSSMVPDIRVRQWEVLKGIYDELGLTENSLKEIRKFNIKTVTGKEPFIVDTETKDIAVLAPVKDKCKEETIRGISILFVYSTIDGSSQWNAYFRNSGVLITGNNPRDFKILHNAVEILMDTYNSDISLYKSYLQKRDEVFKKAQISDLLGKEEEKIR